MAKMNLQTRVLEAAISALEKAPAGLRWTELHRIVEKALPDVSFGSVHFGLANLEKKSPKIYRPSRGLLQLRKFEGTPQVLTESPDEAATAGKPKEAEFYPLFQEFLENEEWDISAVKLGGNLFGGKWGTPDVIGIRKPDRKAPIQFTPELVSIEVKTDPSSQVLITAFGQACSYLLFSHEAWIAIPNDTKEEDFVRIESLCRTFGIGLVKFDRLDIHGAPTIRLRPIKRSPDFHYLNENLQRFEDHDKDGFRKLMA